MSGLHFKKRICLLLTAAALLFGPGCLQAQAKGNFYGAFEFSAQPMPENFCAITFDDGPSTFTPHLLDMLDEAGIHATFLMLGKNAAFYPDIVKRALAEGHEVGNHSYSHPNLRRLSYDAIEDQISKTNDILRSLGADPKVMRPPYGNSNANVEKAAEKLGLKVITWNMDSLDWKRLPEDYTKIPNEFGRPWEPGHAHGVYLFHDIHKRTVDDFPRMFAELKAAGCQRFVTVSDYLDNLFDDQEPVMLMERRHVQPAAAAAASAEVSQTESAAAQAQTPRKRLQKALRRLPPPRPLELPRHLPQRLLTALRRLRTLPPRKPRRPHLFLMPASPENRNASSGPGPGSPRIPSTSWPPRTRTLPYRSLPDRQHPPKHTLLKPGRQPSPEHLVISLPQETSSNFSPKRERVSVRRTLTLFF